MFITIILIIVAALILAALVLWFLGERGLRVRPSTKKFFLALDEGKANHCACDCWLRNRWHDQFSKDRK